jgi:hypothetical protein
MRLIHGRANVALGRAATCVSPYGLLDLHELDSNFTNSAAANTNHHRHSDFVSWSREPWLWFAFDPSSPILAGQALEIGRLFDTFPGAYQLTAAGDDCTFATSR